MISNFANKHEFTLSAPDIDAMSSLAEEYLEKKKIERKEILRLKISMENVLLGWRDSLGEETKIGFILFRRYGKQCVQLQCAGPECDPFRQEDELGEWASSLRQSLESVPTYDYVKNINTVCFRLHKPRMSRLLLILLFLAAGILLGLAGFVLPEAWRQSVCETILTPLYNTYLSLFSFCGLPLIFLSVVTGILGVGSIHSFSLIGRKMVKRFFFTTFFAALITMAVGLVVFRLDLSGNPLNVQYSDFFSMILGWLPTGLFQPFIEGNALQLIIMGIAFGFGILILDKDKGHLSGFMYDTNSLLLEFSRWMSALIPLFVFVSVINSMWQSQSALLLSAWKSWAATTGLQAAVILAMALNLCRKYKISLGRVLRKISKTFFVALGTNSCAVSVPANYSCCAEKLGIDDKVYSFGIPIGTSIFKPATAIRLIFLCLFMVTGDNYMPVSAEWLVMLFVMSLILSVATPAIPGGTLMLCSMLFTQLGIPTAVLTQMLTTDVFFDCVCTAFNQVAVSLSLASYASTQDMLNESVLLSES